MFVGHVYIELLDMLKVPMHKFGNTGLGNAARFGSPVVGSSGKPIGQNEGWEEDQLGGTAWKLSIHL
jgi:hypothetical protein